AVNAKGETAATNNGGLPIKIDTKIPTAPSKPTVSVSGINVTFNWPDAADVGPSGLAFYELQVGTSPGDSSYFNGTVADVSEKEIVGDAGVTIYGRVRVINRAGNVGPWSAASAGATP